MPANPGDASDNGSERNGTRTVQSVNKIHPQPERNHEETKTEHTPLVDGKQNEVASKTPTNFYIYFSHFLTKWGERMWTFAVGLYMIYISPDSLQLTAVYGLSMCATILLLGPVIGDWVDNVQRLRAARLTLILQTTFVILCSGVIYAFLVWREHILAFGDWAKYLAYSIIILLAAASLLANTANTITVEKDWIVQMCVSDEEKLTSVYRLEAAIEHRDWEVEHQVVIVLLATGLVFYAVFVRKISLNYFTGRQHRANPSVTYEDM